MMFYCGFGWFGFLFMILFSIAIIWLIVWAVQQITKSKESKESSLELLEKRFASGEISKKEFLDMKKELRR